MTTKVKADVSTHFPNNEKVDVEQGDDKLNNSQKAQMLMDPEDLESGSTHSEEEPKHDGPKKAPTVAKVAPTPAPTVAKAVAPTKTVAKAPAVKANNADQSEITDEELPKGGKIAEIDNEVDPAAGYLDKTAGMPVINNASVEGIEEDEEDEFEDLPEVKAEFGDDGGENEFDEGDDNADGVLDEDEFDEMETLAPDTELEVEGGGQSFPGEAPYEEAAQFEGLEETTDDVPLVDVDGIPDDDEAEHQFASIGAALHVIRANRIIASMGPATARKAQVADVYMMDQFQDVVAHAISTKGLRKGLVQSGFVLAKVRISASSKATDKAVKAKVQAALTQKTQAMVKQEAALEQSLAIASVGINRHFFKDANNDLKAGLETELERAGVRGGSRLVRAMFAQHGVSYAKAILTLAKKISAMPEEVRNQYADALDMTEDTDFGDEDPDDGQDDEAEDDMVEFTPHTVTSALANPLRRDTQILRAAQSSEARQILSGVKSLV